jgi:hypothetical protein
VRQQDGVQISLTEHVKRLRKDWKKDWIYQEKDEKACY